jgi:hypothetical protein
LGSLKLYQSTKQLVGASVTLVDIERRRGLLHGFGMLCLQTRDAVGKKMGGEVVFTPILGYIVSLFVQGKCRQRMRRYASH